MGVENERNMLSIILDKVITVLQRKSFRGFAWAGRLPGIALAGLILAVAHPAGAQVTQGELVATFPFGAQSMVYDYSRNRVYATVPASNSVAIIDAQRLKLISMIPIGSNPQGISISQDNTRLYVANAGETATGIGIVDLNSLVALTGFSTASAVTSVFAGLNNQLYILSGSIYMLNATNGTVLAQISGGIFLYGGEIRGTPDGKNLFYAQSGLDPSTLYRIDISGTNLVVKESISPGENGESLTVSPLGHYVVFPNGYPYDIPLFSATNLQITYGTFSDGAYPSLAAFDPAERYFYEIHTSDTVGMWSISNFVQTGAIATDIGGATGMLVDNTGTLLFISTGSTIEVRGTGAPALASTNLSGPKLTISQYADPLVPLLQLGWQTQISQSYQFQTSIDLVHWTNAGSPVTGNGAWTNFYDLQEDGSKFYRLQIQNQ